MLGFSEISLLAFNIDGTLTDATTWWGGDAVGWLQHYSLRDGEALLRIKQKIPVVALSSNKTASARARLETLGLDARWLGVNDKREALEQICREYAVDVERVGFVGDGLDDVDVFERVGLGCAVADAHPRALRAAHIVLESPGGARVIEEIERRML